MRGRVALLVVAGVLAVAGPLTHVGAAGGPYRFLHDIHVGGEGGWDYLSVDSVAKRLYVSHGTKVVVIDTGRDAVVGEVSDTPGVHGMIAVRDLGRGFRYVVAARWPIAPAADASGLAIDLSDHRLFVGAHNGLMLMMDSSNGTVLSRVPIGTGVDATWFDPGTGYVFSSCSDGTTTVAHEDSPEKLTVVQTLPTERGARTMALDPATHRIYLAAVRFGPPHPGAPPNARPTALPDSMRILVYELVR